VNNVEIPVRRSGGTAVGIGYTDTNGNYTITGLANGTYTVTPFKLSLTFTPTSRRVTILDADATNVNFTRN
jgi:hypothetical protein